MPNATPDRPLEITEATVDLADRLTDIARAAKAHWGYPEAWLVAWRSELTVSPNTIRNDCCYVARKGDRVLGFYVLAGTGITRSLEHLWVEPRSMGQGVGKALLRHARIRARQDGARRLHIESDPHAEGFYDRQGAVRVGESIGQVEGEPRVLPLLELDLT